METLANYRQAILNVITPFPTSGYDIPEIKTHVITDKDTDTYLLIRTGWRGDRNYYSVIIHMAIVGGEIIIYQNNTDRELDEELTDEGVAPAAISLAYIKPD
ncbi:element excision factor XisI family protein [Hymenobacter terrenus]|uniref:element excision factor XisI family protein n=1 Tax=Hymenobacter terrenus TaxID=1629124 RepID=UPI0006199DA2|nr:element excision factor XisI family protein [Hymenobacter terrenus]